MSWLFPKGKKINVGDILQKAYGQIPEEKRNEVGMALIERYGGIEKLLDSLPPEEKAKAVIWSAEYDAQNKEEREI